MRQLLCMLTKDNNKATEELNTILMTRITSALKDQYNMPDIATSVRHEMLLLSASVQKEDKCWEQRVRCGECRLSLLLKYIAELLVDYC